MEKEKKTKKIFFFKWVSDLLKFIPEHESERIFEKFQKIRKSKENIRCPAGRAGHLKKLNFEKN